MDHCADPSTVLHGAVEGRWGGIGPNAPSAISASGAMCLTLVQSHDWDLTILMVEDKDLVHLDSV